MPNVIGYPSGMSAISSMEMKNVYFGEDAIKNESKLRMAYPVQAGHVQNWDDMEQMWDFVFKQEMRLDPRDFNVLITEALVLE